MKSPSFVNQMASGSTEDLSREIGHEPLVSGNAEVTKVPCQKEPDMYGSNTFLGLPAYSYATKNPTCQEMGYSFGYEMEGCLPSSEDDSPIAFNPLKKTDGECAEGFTDVLEALNF
jgi:hypothetical protein